MFIPERPYQGYVAEINPGAVSTLFATVKVRLGHNVLDPYQYKCEAEGGARAECCRALSTPSREVQAEQMLLIHPRTTRLRKLNMGDLANGWTWKGRSDS